MEVAFQLYSFHCLYLTTNMADVQVKNTVTFVIGIILYIHKRHDINGDFLFLIILFAYWYIANDSFIALL